MSEEQRKKKAEAEKQVKALSALLDLAKRSSPQQELTDQEGKFAQRAYNDAVESWKLEKNASERLLVTLHVPFPFDANQRFKEWLADEKEESTWNGTGSLVGSYKHEGPSFLRGLEVVGESNRDRFVMFRCRH
jgi:hypothetical protein